MSETEYAAAYKAMRPMVQCAMDLAVLTGLRRGDLLALTRANLNDDGLCEYVAEQCHFGERASEPLLFALVVVSAAVAQPDHAPQCGA